MKKLIIVLFLTFATLSASAQFRFGFEGGLNLCNLYTGLHKDVCGPIVRFNLGMDMEYIFGNNMGVRFQPHYGWVGARSNNNYGLAPNHTYKNHLQYNIHKLEFPIYFQYFVKDYHLNLMFGPQPGIILARPTNYKKYRYNPQDLGLSGGVEWMFKDNIGLQFLYAHTLTYTVGKGDAYGQYDTAFCKQSTFSINIVYRLF